MDFSLKPTIDKSKVAEAKTLLLHHKPVSIEWNEGVLSELAHYCVALLDINEKVNLTGAKSLDELIIKHVLDTVLAIQAPFPFSKKIVDVGSGGGIPGLILAILWPDSTVHLVERRQKKSLCLRELVGSLGLEKRVYVHAEDLAQIRPQFIVEDLWFRGVMPGDELAEFLSSTFPRGRKGRVILLKGPRWADEKIAVESSKKALPEWKDAIVKNSKDYSYSLPENAGERVLVYV